MEKNKDIHSLFEWQSQQVNVVDIYQGPPNLFLLPNQVAYVVDCRTQRIMDVMGNFLPITGYRNAEFKDVSMVYDAIAPEDISNVMDYTRALLSWAVHEKEVAPLESMGVCHFRIKKKNGDYVRVMQQVICLQKVGKVMTYFLGLFTDIDSFDVKNSFAINIYGPAHEKFMKYYSPLNPGKRFTPRELDIIKLLAEGKGSIEIGQRLGLSPHTVNTHRRNMIRKVKVKNTLALVNLARELELV